MLGHGWCAGDSVALHWILFAFVWKLGTEWLRPLAGEPIWEFIERGGSYAAPLALLWLRGWPRTLWAQRHAPLPS